MAKKINSGLCSQRDIGHRIDPDGRVQVGLGTRAPVGPPHPIVAQEERSNSGADYPHHNMNKICYSATKNSVCLTLSSLTGVFLALSSVSGAVSSLFLKIKEKKIWCAEIKPQTSQFVDNKKELTRINFIFS